MLIVGILPILQSASLISWVSDADTALAIVAGLFLLSLPLGYVEHQMVVNVYRSHKISRAVFKILEDMVLEAQDSCNASEKPFFRSFDDLRKNSFLTSLLDLCVYSRRSTAETNIFNRLSERWSHFYARRSVGRYAPIVSVTLWMLLVVIGYIFSWPIVFRPINFGISIILWVVIFILCVFLIDSYAKKIWLEISFLETSIVLANRDEVEPIIKRIVSFIIDHPEYIERGESYGRAIYRL
jgi:hypothetical protein